MRNPDLDRVHITSTITLEWNQYNHRYQFVDFTSSKVSEFFNTATDAIYAFENERLEWHKSITTNDNDLESQLSI